MTTVRKRFAKRFALLVTLVVAGMGGALFVSMGSRSDLVPVGQAAPSFVAQASDETRIDLSSLQGHKRVVLVFYPGDYTPVCTAQLCAFRDNWMELQTENSVVYGINPAPVEKHAGFAAQNHLPFPLIVDTDGEIARRYGCLAPLGLVKRTVYVIDRRGKVAWVERGNPSPSNIVRVLHGLKDTIDR